RAHMIRSPTLTLPRVAPLLSLLLCYCTATVGPASSPAPVADASPCDGIDARCAADAGQIRKIALSSTSVAAGQPPGTVVGAISVTMSDPPPFWGSISIGGSGANLFGVSGDKLVTAQALANGAGPYSVTLTATQSGASTSPYPSPPFSITVQSSP